MVIFSVSPMLSVLLAHNGVERGNGLESVMTIALIQVALWLTQRRCSGEDLSYWDGLLVTAASVTTGENLISLLRAFCLLLVVVIASSLYAVEHDERFVERHAEIRYAMLIISLHKRRLWKSSRS
jgi:hypothetical protein